MDNAILILVVDELRRSLTGAALGDVVQIDSRRFALRFSVSPFHRLCVALHPDLSALHLARRVATPGEPTEIAAALTERLAGLTLDGISKNPEERVVELEFRGQEGRCAFLVLELMGKASNLLLLDAERRILRFVRSHQGAFRQPREGEIYVPPPPRAAGERSLLLGSRLLEKEIALRAAAGESEEAAREEIAARISEARFEPCLYTSKPPGEIGEDEELTARTCFAAPFPMRMGEGFVLTRFATANEATAAHADLMIRHLLFRDLRGALASLVKAELDRTDRLVGTLESEEREAEGADGVRRRAEMILASIGSAKKEGDAVEVIDYYQPDLPKVRISIDPKLDLKGNVEALFRRARKQGRAAAVIARRLAETRARLASLREFALRAAEAASSTALEALEVDLNRSGLVKMLRRPGRTELGRRPSFVRVREYRTSDGFTVLVGKSGAENDTLTFKVAAPNDFWFHAAGRAGAHVIVRNPKRLRDLPETTLMEAAAIAAWYSKGDRVDEMDVHYTRRKEVRKGKGMSPGMVMLRNHGTVRVRPALPGGAKGEE